MLYTALQWKTCNHKCEISWAWRVCSGKIFINLSSSTDVNLSRRMQVVFIASGCMHAQYNKILKQGLGKSAVNASSFYETIKLLHPIVNTMVNEMCEMAKDEMKVLSPTTVGSWQQAITSLVDKGQI